MLKVNRWPSNRMCTQLVTCFCDINLEILHDKMNRTYIVLLLSSILVTLAKLESTTNQPEQTTIQACGKILATTLSVVCHSVYNTYPPARNARSLGNPSIDVGGILSLLRTREAAKSFVTFRRRRKRTPGVNDECCKKSCSLDEMRTYCG